MNERQAYTVTEAAETLGLSVDAVYEGVRRGEIPSVRIGRRIVIPRRRFEAWLNGRDAVVESSAMVEH